MADVHLKKNGDWERCYLGAAACTRRYHIENFTVAEAKALPSTILWQLLAVTDPPKFQMNGAETWHDRQGLLHRDYDLPAYRNLLVTRWWQHGKLHRDHDRPAAVYASGRLEWQQHDEMHRDNDQPAVISPDNDHREWWQRGKLHRVHDLPAVTENTGYKAWYQHDVLHRGGNKPAVITHAGEMEWWVEGIQVRSKPGPHSYYIKTEKVTA